MTEQELSCINCKFRLAEDFGYSNYTVEGTSFNCLRGLHPEMPFDEFYGKDKRLEYARQCSGFVRGEGVYIDCDREDLAGSDAKLSSAYTTDPEIIPLLDAWEDRQ